MEPLTTHATHSALGATFTELKGRELVRSYAPLHDELLALRESAGLFDASAREWLKVTGEDRKSFLHGMVTNEVNKLPAGRATYAALLTNKGAMVADLRLWNREDHLLLDVEPGYGETVRATLGKYLISEDAELHDVTPELALLWLGGPKVAELLRRAAGIAESPALHATASGVVDGVPVTAIGAGVAVPGAVELLVRREQLGKVWDALLAAGGVRPVGFEALEALRVEAGVPRFGQDMDETTIPLEADLKRAIDYQKGCYIGQEVIARGTFRGQMNKKLAGLVLGAELPPLRSELRRGEKKVGTLTSAVKLPGRDQVIALGYVHRDSLDAGTVLDVKDHSAKATVHPLPFRAG